MFVSVFVETRCAVISLEKSKRMGRKINRRKWGVEPINQNDKKAEFITKRGVNIMG